MSKKIAPPRVFISYSWTTQEFEELVVQWAERLVQDGVDAILDKWNLKEGHDKFAYMESMVNDSEVKKVIMFCDQAYSKKADGRQGGVGTETQIITSQLYSDAEQTKFIPVGCELDDQGKLCFPTFLKSRIHIDFSSPERVEAGWEKLIRAIYDKPLYKRPEIGKTPSYLLEDEAIANKASSKFLAFKNAVYSDRPIKEMLRRDYVSAVYSGLAEMRIAGDSNEIDFKQTLRYLDANLDYRDQIIEYFLITITTEKTEDSIRHITSLFQKMLPLKYRLEDQSGVFYDWWWDHQGFHLHELLLYLVALCLKEERFDFLRKFLSKKYLYPNTSPDGGGEMNDFHIFYSYSKALRAWNSTLEQKWESPEGQMIKIRASNEAVYFEDLIEADYLLSLRSQITNNQDYYWYGHTLIYGGWISRHPFLVKAKSKEAFKMIVPLLGVSNKHELENVKQKAKDSKPEPFRRNVRRMLENLDIESLDTI
ncbi:SEFIR domain-containing protein [Coraliomargarita sp. W4R53]